MPGDVLDAAYADELVAAAAAFPGGRGKIHIIVNNAGYTWDGVIHRMGDAQWETMLALHDLVQSGKVRYIGASNLKTWQLAEMMNIAERHGWTKFVSVQVEHSLLYRTEVRSPAGAQPCVMVPSEADCRAHYRRRR